MCVATTKITNISVHVMFYRFTKTLANSQKAIVFFQIQHLLFRATKITIHNFRVSEYNKPGRKQKSVKLFTLTQRQ